MLYGIIKLILRYPEHAARTTAEFIQSPTGVMHALKLAKDEMQTITADKWEKGVWEAATSRGTNELDTASSNLILYWGENARPML
ncbi:hypothetical protein MMC31_007191 [Peltigera leucophlebia]|nr:hypothetical protein [Peltigera leucophlebia]